MKRIIADILLFLFALSGPWWIAYILGIYFLAIFDSFYEILFAGFIIDIIFMNSSEQFPILTITSFVLLIASAIVKKRIRNF